MVVIPAGDFLMGSAGEGGYPGEESPQHKVYLKAFLIDKYEVTNELFSVFLNAVKSSDNFEEKRMSWVTIRSDIEKEESGDWWPTEIVYEGGIYISSEGFDKYPVLSVSWHAANAYCRWAGKRLPTEAEWEKAARGRLSGKDYPWGNEVPTDGVIFKKIWKSNLYPSPVERVGNYHPNGYGLFDVAGNISEWCADWYNSFYYKNSPVDNPRGPDSGVSRVIRGGSWASTSQYLRVSFRNYSSPDRLNSGVGFRCAKDFSDE